MATIILHGCAPVPLAHYLKALGILRLVSESGDSNATGCWKSDAFIITSKFDSDGLVEFFQRQYKPTPILSPWNGGSGFYLQEEKLNEKDPLTGKKKKTGIRNQPTEATRVVAALEVSTDARFSDYRSAISLTRSILEERGLISAPSDAEKNDLLLELRNRWPDAAVRWLDCVLVLISNPDKARAKTGLLPSYTTLLGSGANDGNADFSSNFMQRLQSALLDEECVASGRSASWLRASLYAETNSGVMVEALAGQYSPGSAGGPNTCPGFKGKFAVNPWDFILLIEGALTFAAAAVKRHGENGPSGIAYPFAVRSSGVGYASANTKDEVADKSNNEELWLPLWDKPTLMGELITTFSEGRAQIGKSFAATGVDFARAICANGTDRGFSEFIRYGFLIRRGDSSSATPLGRFRVQRNAQVELLADIEPWLTRLRYKADPNRKVQGKDRKAPASLSSAFNLLQRRILELCGESSQSNMEALVAALGATERTIARSFNWSSSEDNSGRANIYPLQGLSAEWLIKTGNSLELRLASSVAGTSASFGRGKETLWFRQHLEPLKRVERGEWFKPAWSDLSTENDVAWHDGDLTDALNAILARRLVRVEKSGVRGWPDWSPRTASIEDITAFIERRTNDVLLADLIWGLSLLDWANIPEVRNSSARDEAIPSSFYALLRLCLRRANTCDEQDEIPLVPAILQRAIAGYGTDASELAARRLRASGRAPLVRTLPVSGDIARRTAAAMLFPIAPRDFRILEQNILKPINQQST